MTSIRHKIPNELLYEAEMVVIQEGSEVTVVKDKKSEPEEYVVVKLTETSLHHLNKIFQDYRKFKSEQLASDLMKMSDYK